MKGDPKEDVLQTTSISTVLLNLGIKFFPWDKLNWTNCTRKCCLDLDLGLNCV